MEQASFRDEALVETPPVLADEARRQAQKLHRDRRVEALVMRAIDDAETAFPDDLVDSVLAGERLAQPAEGVYLVGSHESGLRYSLVMPIPETRIFAVLCLLALTACKKDKAPAPAASTGAPGPVASAPPPAPARPDIPDRAIGSSWTADKLRWVQAFRTSYPAASQPGMGWKEARAACEGAGLDLCTEDQWVLACGIEPKIGGAPSWTISPTGAAGWVVRGGAGCDSKSEAASGSGTPGRIGLCCERRASMSTSKNRQEAVMKAAQTYATLVEGAVNSGDPSRIAKLLANDVLLYKTRSNPDKATKDLAWDMKRYPKMDTRFISCDTDVAGADGNWECETVGTRESADGKQQLSVYRQRFEYVQFKYTVFGDPVLIKRVERVLSSIPLLSSAEATCTRTGCHTSRVLQTCSMSARRCTHRAPASLCGPSCRCLFWVVTRFTYPGADGSWFVSDAVRRALVASGCTGIEFARARVTTGRTS